MQSAKVSKKYNMKYPRMCKDMEYCLKAGWSRKGPVIFLLRTALKNRPQGPFSPAQRGTFLSPLFGDPRVTLHFRPLLAPEKAGVRQPILISFFSPHLALWTPENAGVT